MWHKITYYLASMRIVQNARLYFGNLWVLIRKNDARFIESAKIHYKGDSSVPPTKYNTDRSDWNTLVVFKLVEGSSPAYIAVDDVFGNRLACLGRMIYPGEKIALRVGHEGADALFISPRDVHYPPKIKLVIRCQEINLTLQDDKPTIL